MFTALTAAAVVARPCPTVCGAIPPPMSASPPTAVMPLTALVTLMSGECSAGVTPHTTLYPTMPASVNVVSMCVSDASGAT